MGEEILVTKKILRKSLELSFINANIKKPNVIISTG